MSGDRFRIHQACATRKLDADASDFVRVIRDESSACILMGNASRSDFEIVAPELSRLMLDASQEAWIQSNHLTDPNERLHLLFVKASSLIANHREASAWLTAACLWNGSIFIEWAGGDEVWLLNQNEIVDRTQGHSFKPAGSDVKAPTFLTRGLGSGYESTEPQRLKAPWVPSPGSQVIVLSRSVVLSQPVHHVATSVASLEGTTALVEEVVQDDRHLYAAVAALNID